MEITEYSSKSCPACKEMKPELKKLEKAGIKVNIIDCDKNDSKCKDIRHAPTLVIKKGGKSKKIIGFATAEDIRKKFERL